MAGKHRRTKASDDSSSDDDHEIAKKLKKISHVKREIQKKQEKTYKTLKNVCDDDSGSEEKKAKDRPFMTYLPSSTAKMFSISDSSSDSDLNSSKKVEKESPKNKKSKKVREKVSTSDSDMETVKEIHKKRIHSPVKRTSEQKMSYRKKRESDSSSSKEFQKAKRKRISEVDDAGTSLGEYTIIETPIKSEVANVKVNKKQEVKLKNSTLEVIEQLQKIVEGLLSELESQSNYFMDKDIKVVGDANFIPHKIFQTYKSAFLKIKKNRNDFNSIYKSWVDSCCESSNSAVNKRFPKPFICNKSDSSVSDSYVLETVSKNLNKTKNQLSPKISNESEDSDNSKKKLKKNLNITKISDSKVERSKVNKACKTTDDESSESNSSEEKQTESGVKTNQDKKFNLSLTKSDSEQSHKSNLKSYVRRSSIENKSLTLSKGINEDKPNKSNSVSNYSLSPVSDCDVDKIFSEEESSRRVSRKSISKHSSKEEESLTLVLSKETNEDEPINPVNDIRGSSSPTMLTENVLAVSDRSSNRLFSDKESSCGKSQANKKVAMEGDTKGNEEKVKGLNDVMNKLYSKSASTSDEDLFDESTASEVTNTPTKSPILSKTKGFKKTLLASQTSSAPSVIENEPVVTNTPKSPILTKTKRFKKILLASQTSSASSVTEHESMEGKETEVEAATPEEVETEAKATEPKESNVQAKTITEQTSEIDVISGTKTASKKEINDVVAEDVELAAMENLLQDCDSDQSVNSSCSTLILVANTSIPKELQKETEQTPRKQKKLVRKQTKKHNSVSSDSSEESMDEREGRTSRQKANGNASRRASQRAFDLRKKMKADKKVFTECRVTMERLSKSVLKKHARALAKSKKYVEKKKIHSMTNLDSLESKKKSKKSADNDTTTKAKKENKSKKNLGKDHSDEENDILFDNDSPSEVNDKDKSLLNESNNEQALEKEIEEVAKQNLLKNSSDEEENVLEVEERDTKKLKSLKIKIKNINNVEEIKITEKNGDEKMSENKKKDNWKKDKVLTFNMTDTDSDEEKLRKSLGKKKAKEEEEKDASISEEIAEDFAKSTGKKKSKPRKRQRILDSDDSDANVEILDEDSSSKESESEEEKKEEKKKKGKKRKNSSDSDASSGEKKSKSKRKRIKKVVTDSESDDQESPSKGRKNIRKVLKDKHVADDTKKAAQDEEDRLKRIAERQRLFNEMYDARLAGEAKVDKLVLDIDEETKEELVVVDEELVKRLKPHQAQGIKFMWDACFESLKQIEKSEGSGCIIAHCMGLGKTFQVVTLSHTLLSHEETGVKTVMVVCPLSTVLNWVNEFKTWLKHVENSEEIEIYELTKLKKNTERKYMLESWQKTGGVLIIGYEMFRNLTSTGKKMRKAMQESIMRSLVDPGADLVVCDEGHLLKNEESALSKAMRLVRTLRRIVLTGTPLQNNLKEYHCMVQFVKPNLLGTKKEFLNRFVNPITNGQFDDSTPYDVKLMKKRAHVLHKMLEGCVQRFDYSVLTPFLPPKQEYVIFVRLTEVQIKMYQHYIDNFARRFGQRNGSLFADFQELQRIWTHPYVLRLNAEKVEKANEKKRLEASDSEGSLKDFIDDDSDSDVSNISSSSDNSNSDVQCIDSDKEKQPTRSTRSTRGNIKDEPEEIVPNQETAEEAAWWSKFVEEEHFEDLRISTKLVLLFGILRESEQIGDKVLVFSQSLYSLTLIEQFLNLIDQETQEGRELEHLDNHSGRWQLGLDYFRLDGSTSAENRSAWCKIFNNPNNTRARLFLISTRAGGLGINLTAANRVIIFDASWNPSHDVQSIFRIYRFGQKKPCYVYRFLAAGTMEEKIYNRQVTKLSLACRVVDEQQIERHYSNNDLAELYQFESYEGKSITLNLPKDRLLAEIFLKYKDAVYNYHEHDSLLENKEEEELDEEERKQAWLEYEEEKQGKRQMINPMMNNMGNNMLLNQMLMNVTSFPEFENIKLLIQKDYPNLPPEHLDTVARQAMYDMYRFVDQHAVSQLLNPFANRNPMQQNLLGTQPMTHQQQQYNQQNQLMNMLTQPQMNYTQPNHMPAYSGRGRPPKHLSMNNPMLAPMTMQQQQMQQAPIQQAQIQQPLIQQQQVQQPTTDNNEVEIVSDRQVTPPNTDSASNADDKKAE